MRLLDEAGPVLLLAALPCAVGAMLAWHKLRVRRILEAARMQCQQARFAEDVATRVLRLSSDELRQPSMALLSHADRLRAGTEDASAHAAAISALATRFLDLADDMQDHAVSAAESRVLRDETVRLGPLIDEAIATVSVMLGPTRRHWQVAPSLRNLSVWADHRALRQVIRRVLANAARYSNEGDWIDIRMDDCEDGLALVIEDEGTGLTTSEHTSNSRIFDSRGLGLGLSLSRALMQAHGGRLTVVSAPRVGTRYTLYFPASRLQHDSPKVMSSA
jgi:signal transduction histidine kinase